MAIRMRNNTKPDSVCCECGDHRKDVLDMFDVCVGGNIFTLCDVCNEALLYKTLRAECAKNARVNCIVTDKDVYVSSNVNLSGNENMPFYVQKGRKV